MKDCKATLEAWLQRRQAARRAGSQAAGRGHAAFLPQPQFRVREVPRRSALQARHPHGSDPPGESRRGIRHGLGLSRRRRSGGLHSQVQGPLPGDPRQGRHPSKEGGKFQFKPLGQGALNWKDIFAAGREAGVEWYVYEQDGGEGSPFDYARASYEFLKKNLP